MKKCDSRGCGESITDCQSNTDQYVKDAINETNSPLQSSNFQNESIVSHKIRRMILVMVEVYNRLCDWQYKSNTFDCNFLFKKILPRLHLRRSNTKESLKSCLKN